MSATLQLLLLQLTDKFSLDEPFMLPRFLKIMLFKLNETAVMLLI